jgi:SynChlorMet cassette protein ScmC
VCVLEPQDATEIRRRPPGEERNLAELFTVVELTEEQWLWRQLTRVSAALSRETMSHGGMLVHSALAQYGEHGVLLAGRSGIGKTTASLRLPPPWRSVSDDATLVVRNQEGKYRAHPWPTWSRLIGDNKWDEGCSWNVHKAVPLRAVFLLEQGDEDRAEPAGPGHAAGMLAELVRQTSRYLQRHMTIDEISALNLHLFNNVCSLAKAVPSYTLQATLEGEFWKEIERVLSSQEEATPQ